MLLLLPLRELLPLWDENAVGICCEGPVENGELIVGAE
jgi:hypothetical protein